MSAPLHPLAAIEQELADLLDELPDRLGSRADHIASRVGLARSWLQELEQEVVQLKALVKPAPEQKHRLRHLPVDVSYCQEIISKYDDLQRASAVMVSVASAAAHEERLSAASASSAPAAAPPSGLTKTERAEWFRLNLPAPSPLPKVVQRSKKSPVVPIAPVTCDSAATPDLQPAAQSALTGGGALSDRASPSSRFCLTITEDACVSGTGSLLCAVKVEKGELCRQAIIRNRDGAIAVVKNMVDAAKQKIDRAEEGACVSISLGPVVGSKGQKIDDSVTLDAKMLKRGAELRSAVALSCDTEKGNEHLLWYKVTLMRALLPACLLLTHV
jgi:hypothetical protein